MKKLGAFLIIVIVLSCFSGCNKSETYAAVTEAVENTVALQRYRAKFVAEMKIEDTTLFFAQGAYSIDREKQLSSTECVQSYNGTSSKLTQFYSDGVVYSDFDGEKTKSAGSAEDFFNCLYYSQAIQFKVEDIKNLKKDTNSNGTLYRFTVKSGYDEQLMAVIGVDVFSLAKIVKPQEDMTRFSEVECEYTVTQDENGNLLLATRQLVFTAYLYDTPGYTPGYTPPEEEYMTALQVRLSINYEAFGDQVSVEAPMVEEYSSVD